MTIHRMLHAGMCIALSLTLSSCGTQEKSPFNAMVGRYASFLVGGVKPQEKMTLEKLRSVLTPAVVAQFGGNVLMVETENQGTAAGFLSVARNGSTTTWMTQDGQASVSLRNGIVIATKGFGFDLLSADMISGFSASDPPSVQVREFQHLDGENQVVTTRYKCVYSNQGSELREHCSTGEHEFLNTYVRSKSGQVLHSRQWISPQIEYLVLESVFH